MRSILFAIAYYAISITHVLAAAVAALRPGRGAVRRVISRFGKRMVWAMRVFAGIKLEVRGRENLPEGAFIIAPKHQSWGDGFCSFSQFDDVAFVTGDHLERFPLFKPILRKLGAIVVDNCGGPEARNALQTAASQAHKEGRKILIYPEGHLAPVGVRYRYRSGVYYMSRDFDMQVVPVATNLGCFWPQQSFWKRPGTAVIEFLPPIPTGLKRTEFLTRLEKEIEDRTAELVAEATGKPVTPSVLEVPDAEKERAAARAAKPAEEAEPAE